MQLAGVHVMWWVVLGSLAWLVLWGFVEGTVLAPRRAARKFGALAAALQRPVARESAFMSSVAWQVDDRPIAVRTTFVGSAGSMRGVRGHLCVVATPLRAPAWAMHDVEIRPVGRTGTWDERFGCVESGVPVRENWLSDPVREAVARLLTHPLVTGRLRTDRGELQFVAPWSQVGDTSQAEAVRGLLARFNDVAMAFDRAAARPLRLG